MMVKFQTHLGELEVKYAYQDSLGYHVVTGKDGTQRTWLVTRAEFERIQRALEQAPEATQISSRATKQHPQLSGDQQGDQVPWLDPEEQSWNGCGFYFDGCSCHRCEEAERRNRFNRRLCEALELPQGQYPAGQLEERLNQVLNDLAAWVERQGYVNDLGSEEGRRYARLCEVLGVAPGMRHSRYYWKLKLNRLLGEVS